MNKSIFTVLAVLAIICTATMVMAETNYAVYKAPNGPVACVVLENEDFAVISKVFTNRHIKWAMISDSKTDWLGIYKSDKCTLEIGRETSTNGSLPSVLNVWGKTKNGHYTTSDMNFQKTEDAFTYLLGVTWAIDNWDVFQM